MNTETGEVRKLTAEAVAELNGMAGKELWVPYDDYNPIDRKTRRALERKMAKAQRKQNHA